MAPVSRRGHAGGSTLRALLAAIASAVLVLAATPLIGAASPHSRAVTWGAGQQIPGLTSLNAGGDSDARSISCASARSCAAGGSFLDARGSEQGFVVSEHHGTWGSAQVVRGLGDLNADGSAVVSSVSCANAGNCASAGWYTGTGGLTHGFVVDETGGTWGVAQEVPGLAALGAVQSIVFSVSCGAAGDCVAVGNYSAAGGPRGFVVEAVGGTWGAAQAVPGLSTLSAGGSSGVSSVSCSAAGACTAGGYYASPGGEQQGFVVDETGGTWGNAQGVPGLAALNVGARGVDYAPGVDAISCSAAGDCAAVGEYSDAHGAQQAFSANEANGTWGTAQEVPGLGALNAGGWAIAPSVSCTGIGTCAAVVDFDAAGTWPTTPVITGFVVQEAGGRWGAKRMVRGGLGSVSCGAAGSCTAVGPYEDGLGAGPRGDVVVESDGKWGTPDVSAPVSSKFESVSCASRDHCTAIGDDFADNRVESFSASEPGVPPICSPTSGLTADVTGHWVVGGDVDFRIAFTNNGSSACKLTGIPGAVASMAHGRSPVGPPARRTPLRGRGGAVYLEQRGGVAEATFVINMAVATRSKSCDPKQISVVIIRPSGVLQLVVPLNDPSRTQRLICRGLRNEAIFGFESVG